MEAVHDLDWLNALSSEAAREELLKCCGATRWTTAVEQGRPYASLEQLLTRGSEVWWSLDRSDWLEAFRSHPKIGEKKAVTAQTQQEQSWSSQEQSATHSASTDTVARLARGNQDYEAKFGFIFIVCASGKSSDEMFAILNDRLSNDAEAELKAAAQEQQKITRLRLEKLLSQ